jgi:ubiquinone/menaquinone biosynthesis C-methylase UbiE
MAEYKNFNTYLESDCHANVKESFKKLKSLISNPLTVKNTLDVGCATGAWIGYLKNNYPDCLYTGIDISDNLLAIARKKIPGADFIQGSATNLPNEFEGKYDLITCIGVLGIFDEDDAKTVFNELLRCIKPGGQIIFFNQFNEIDVDTQIIHRKYNSHGEDNGWERGWNNYSMLTIKKWLKNRVIKLEFVDFFMPMDLSPKVDPVRSWSILIDNKRRLTNGLKLIIDLKFLIIQAK